MPEISYRQALNQALTEEMSQDSRIFLLGEEVAQYNGAYKVSQGLLERFGNARVVDAPISELGFAGLGIGAAMVGLRPVIEFMTWNFAILAMDQIVNNAAKLRHMSGGQLRCPIVFRGPGGAGGRLSSQHSQALEANYVHFPGLKVLAPGTPADAKGLLKSAIRDENPIIFIEAELLYGMRGEVPENEYVVPIGIASVAHPGDAVTIITWSRMLTACVLPAVQALKTQDIHPEVLDLRSLRPFDGEAIAQSVKKTNRVVIVEESWGFASLGAHLSDFIQRELFDYLDAPIIRVHGRDVNMGYAANIERASQPSVERIIQAVQQVLYL